MDTFIIYIIKSTICFTIFYVCVKAFLSNETFFRFNRRVILFGTLTCLLLPLIQIKVTTDKGSVFQAPIAMLEKTLTEAVPISKPTPIIETERQEIVASGKYGNQDSEPIKIAVILLYIYLGGMVINMFILFRSAYLMASLIRKGLKKTYSKYILVLIPEDIVPFSWGKYIVLSGSDYENNPDEIITHEIAHAKHRHSLDLIFMELVLLFQWFNPAIWLLKRELKDIHEYQADISVLQSGINATKYQLLLVKKAVGASSYTLANSFNHSKIKKRITMMLKEKSNKWARVKLILLLPLGILTVLAFARPEVNKPLTTLTEYESTNILRDTKIPKKEVIRFAPPVIQSDTAPKKKTIKFVPPIIIKDPNTDNIDISSKKIGDRVTDSKGDVWEVTSKNPPRIKFVYIENRKSSDKKNEKISTKENQNTTKKFTTPIIVKDEPVSSDTVSQKKTIRFVPPRIIKDNPKNTQKKKATPPPPPPIKKN